MPPGYNDQHMNTIRQVNPAYQHIDAWISSVGASVAMNDLTGHGRSDGMCIVDTRTNDVIVYLHADRTARRPVHAVRAEPGAAAGRQDDGADGLHARRLQRRRPDGPAGHYWGRTPILFLAKSTSTAPSQQRLPADRAGARDVSGRPVPRPALEHRRGRTSRDLDGNGHPDIVIGNYFPDSDVLDPNGQNNVSDEQLAVQRAATAAVTTSSAGTAAPSGAAPDRPTTSEDKDAIPYADSTGWTLALSAADLTGYGLPDLYIANDFGHGHLLYNVSTPGHISFSRGERPAHADTPKSFVLGNGLVQGHGRRLRRPERQRPASTSWSATSPRPGVCRRATSSS